MKKVLSVFLAVLMAFSVLAVAAVPTSAVSGSGTKASPYVITTWKELSTYLAKSGTAYLKAGNRLYDEASTSPLKVAGTKYLDLNGFEIKRYLKNTDASNMFTVSGKLYINDSSASPKSTDGKGKITFSNWIWTPNDSKVHTAEFVIQRDVFYVESGGVLVLNQGKIIPGESDKSWMYDARQLASANKVYNGNARAQINGNGVTVKKGGQFIMNGGHVEGRGFAAINISAKSVATDCAVKVISGGKAEINGGEVIGMGCADAFQTSSSGLTVRAGFFNTEKIDAVWAARCKYKIAGVTAYRNTVFGGSYGDIGIPESAFKEGFTNKNIAVEIRGTNVIDKTVTPWKLKETTNVTEKRVEVKPIDRLYQSFTTTGGKTFAKLSYIYGIDFYLTSNASFYFPTSQPVNNSDFQVNVISNGKILKTQHYSDSKFNVKDVYNFEPGQTYYLSGYVTQRWNSNDYVVISELSTIAVEVTENQLSTIDLSYDTSALNSSNQLKVGSGRTVKALNIKSKTAGVSAGISIAPKLGRDSVSSADPIKDNGSYSITVTLTPSKGYKVSTNTTVNAFGQSVKISSVRGNTGQAVFNLKAECTHPAKSTAKDEMYHYTVCDRCGKQLSKAEHTFGAEVISGSKSTKTCTSCSYSYTRENGREAVTFVGLSISGGQPAVGDKIPSASLIMSEYWGKRYTMTYSWYKGSVASANKVEPGTKFEKGDYYLVIKGTITDTNQYYFTPDAYAGALLYTDIINTTHVGETGITTTIKVTPLPTATGTITFPDAPKIGDSLYDTVKKFRLTAKSDDGSAIDQVAPDGDGSWEIWVFEQEKDKPQITYCVDYDAASKTLTPKADSIFADITDVKIRGDVKYSFVTMGCPIGYSFHNVKISGGKGADTAEFVEDFLGVKGLFASWEYTPVSTLKDITAPVVTATPGKVMTVKLASDLPYKINYYSIVDNAFDGTAAVPCEKAFSVEVSLSAKDGYRFAEKDSLLLNTTASNVTVADSSLFNIKLIYTFKSTGHTLGTVKTVKPTCTAAGKQTGVCTACGKTVTLATSEKLGHKYVTTTVPATADASGKTVKKCSHCGKTSSSTTIYKIDSIKLSKTKITYDGKVHKPTVTVKDSKGNVLKSGTDYSVKYSNSKSKSTGRYTVTVTFKGKYSGDKVLSYTIVPKKVTGVKVTSSTKKYATVTFSKATGATGYEIQYSTKKSSGFKKLTATTKLKYTKKTLTSGKTYYFKVRAYKTVNGEKLYGAYSSVVSKKIK